MGAITPSFVTELETNMRQITTDAYKNRMRRAWWQKVAKTMPIASKKERLVWLLDTASIERPNAAHGGGQAIFEDIVSQTMEVEVQNASKGLKLKKEQMEDLENGIVGGEGMRVAASWSRQMGSNMAYWPQKCVAKAIRDNIVGYDGKALFAVDHPVNPFDTGAGVYRNVFTGGASGIYPGALPIDSSVTVDVAVANIAKAIAYVSAIPTPNGQDPRGLELSGILVPPALTARAQQITNAKTIAQAATGGAGSADIESVVRNFGLGQPITAPELGSAFGGSDTSYYLLMEEIASDELGALVYVDREPFNVTYHGPLTDAEAARKREYQWDMEGRNVVVAGHPFLIFRCDAT